MTTSLQQTAPPPAAGRLISLERGVNLRDFGGYPTEDGRYVKEATLFRSGTMAYATEADRRALRALGLAAIIDLRRVSERSLEPTDWHDDLELDYWCRDYQESSGILETVRDATSAEAIASMLDVYRAIPYDHAPSLRVLFGKLVEGRVPLLVHCAAGKDRTGVAAALILDVLGVARDLVVEDYVLTNEHIDFAKLFEFRKKSRLYAEAMRKPSAPLFRADAIYIEAMFEKITAEHGGTRGYLTEVLELSSADLAALQDNLTTGRSGPTA